MGALLSIRVERAAWHAVVVIVANSEHVTYLSQRHRPNLETRELQQKTAGGTHSHTHTHHTHTYRRDYSTVRRDNQGQTSGGVTKGRSDTPEGGQDWKEDVRGEARR